VGPAGEQFIYAPRFVSSIALATANNGSSRTQVFAGDTDFNRVVSRTREDASSSSHFAPFDLAGEDVPSPQRLTAFKLANNKPVVVVVSGDGNLYITGVDNMNHWQAWSQMNRPGGTSGFLDAASVYDSNGAPQLYVIASDHQPYVRRLKNSDPSAGWDKWQPLLSSGISDYDHIAAIRRFDGIPQVFLVSTTHAVYTLTQTSAFPDPHWSAPVQFMDAGNPAACMELTVNLTEDFHVEVFAIDAQGGLWTRTMKTRSSSDGWNDWTPWAVKLFAPVATNPPVLNDLTTLTAGQWQEPSSGDRVPVVFATDRQGNIYYTTHSRSQGWQSWLSFYH
jgi:hypothetical protein